MNRRQFLKTSAGTTGLFLGTGKLSLKTLEPIPEIANPLEFYPDKDWEKVYRDQYRYDSSFTYICSPNDTHACRVRAYVRNGVAIRLEQNYDHQSYDDGLGNTATPQWNPRMCLKGFAFQRRVYGPFRLRYPMVRKGWKEWADDGFPELTPENKARYGFDRRGQDEFLRMTWDQAFTYAAKGMIAIAKRYSGNDGRKRLLDEGYPEEMLTHWNEAGTRTFKLRGGMGLLGVIGKYGMNRFANMTALLDSHVRNVGEDKALGARTWSNYTWHGDQAPGHPFVHGLQASDVDFNDLRFSKLVIQVGTNFIENKMPEAHWFVETLERGGKSVVITPEYGPPATRADYWIPVRPGLSDTALFLGVAKIIIDRKWYDAGFVKKFTDLPLLVRTDTLSRLKPQDIFPNYKNKNISQGPSHKIQGLTQEQREKIGDFVVWDRKTGGPKAITRDDVGGKLSRAGVDPVLEGTFRVRTVRGKEVTVMPLFEAYKLHLKDYHVTAVHEITGAPKELIERLARDIATIKPVSIHCGEGINHWFHATLHNRATYLPLMLTGNIGIPGAGCHTWAGNYKSANFQSTEWSGPGILGWVSEDPFHPDLDPKTDGKNVRVNSLTRDEEVGYWAHGDKPLIVETPKYGKRIFTGKSHMPTPTKMMWFSNVNLLNNAKWVYELLKNVHHKIELVISTDVEMTSSIEYSDIAFPANTWMEFETLEVTSSCSNPFLQIWKGGIKPLYDTKDDVAILAGLAQKLGEILSDGRFSDYWKFAIAGKPEVYIQRLLDASSTTRGYKVDEIVEKGGGALLRFRTYPRIPFWEQIHENLPFYTPTGRLQAYNDEPEVIRYGENFIVHREGPEGTPYLPNVIVSANPYIRPDDYGVSRGEMSPDLRTIRNIKMPWKDVKKTKNPLWEKGYRFHCLTPKSRHRVHSQWSLCDWIQLQDSNFSDPFRSDKRTPHYTEHQMQINPKAAKDLGISDGDYVFVDANPDDRPYVGWEASDPFYKVSRLMLRAKYNAAFPYNVVMLYHSAFIATEKSVKAHETRKDGRALGDDGYQANFRYGSQQSLTRSWLMPMHQLDTLFHKSKHKMAFLFGYEADNHGINSVPKETLVKVARAEAGGPGGKGAWEPATTGFSPAGENPAMDRYLGGGYVNISGTA